MPYRNIENFEKPREMKGQHRFEKVRDFKMKIDEQGCAQEEA